MALGMCVCFILYEIVMLKYELCCSVESVKRCQSTGKICVLDIDMQVSDSKGFILERSLPSVAKGSSLKWS